MLMELTRGRKTLVEERQETLVEGEACRKSQVGEAGDTTRRRQESDRLWSRERRGSGIL